MIQETNPNRTVCYNHPDRETSLRCNRCERPICPDCAVLTPTGYRCKECVRGQQKVFDTALWMDYPLAFIIAAVLSYIGLFLLQMVGFWFIMLFLSPVVGMVIAEAVRWATRRRRSRLLFRLAAIATALGALPFLLGPLLALLLGGSLGSLFSLIWPAIYTFLAASTVFYRLSGIQLR